MKDNGKNNKRRPNWDEYFLEIAKVVSSRSTCLRRRYGAVIVKDMEVLLMENPACSASEWAMP